MISGCASRLPICTKAGSSSRYLRVSHERSHSKVPGMSPIQILKLVGFATGATLHLYIAWLIWNRRLGPRDKLTQPVRLITVLNICLGVWFLGNLFITFHQLLLGPTRLTALLRAWDTLAMTGVALLPAALIHAHIGFWATLDDYRKLKQRTVK